jgi:hypothetical protein
MSGATRDGIWLRLCADLIDTLGIQPQHGRPKNHFERLKDLYHCCVLTSLPSNVRVTDVTARIAQITAFHTLVRASIKIIQIGWPSIIKIEVLRTLVETINVDAQNQPVEGPDQGTIDKAIDAALLDWYGHLLVDTHFRNYRFGTGWVGFEK